MAPPKKNVTIDLKVFVGLITALVGTGGYATLNPIMCKPETALEHKLEMRDTSQAWQNRYMLDSIGRVGDNVIKLDRKLDTMVARQERLLLKVLESVRSNSDEQLASRCAAREIEFTMRGD